MRYHFEAHEMKNVLQTVTRSLGQQVQDQGSKGQGQIYKYTSIHPNTYTY